jgi:hypothetical protein
MEYGVFLQPHFNMLWFLIFLGAMVVLAGSVVMAIRTYRRYDCKRETFSESATGKYSAGTIVLSVIAVAAFLTGLVFFIMSFTNNEGNKPLECSSENFASAGYYKIAESKLVYNWEQRFHPNGIPIVNQNGQYVYGRGKPDHFALKLEGRAESKENPDLKMVRCIIIPYTRVVENHTFVPSAVPSAKTEPETKNAPIALPAFAKKQRDGWWQFTETGP